MAGYSRRTWVCPYFKWDEKTKIHCECGVLYFCDNEELGQYAREYCSDFGWDRCTLALRRNRHYGEQEKKQRK